MNYRLDINSIYLEMIEEASKTKAFDDQDTLKIHNSIVRLPMNKPYGFWMDRHGNFAVVRGGVGQHEIVGKQILDSIGTSSKKGVYDTLFSLGWVRIVLSQNKTFYEKEVTHRFTPIQKANVNFINSFYDLDEVMEG